ncbi:hypothetical protein DAEQUDRAFT_223048 [Daedalea quercina L-15889]|uniref:Uncharacterized protein n=1 Tax=Daedalea quercina L-15889 TaxID=1314783 RepID=A0A165QYC3_9APHY|nr:hypothetical protein DAEQUDRAFT_223048 [Daedalea quercina L-15889]
MLAVYPPLAVAVTVSHTRAEPQPCERKRRAGAHVTTATRPCSHRRSQCSCRPCTVGAFACSSAHPSVIRHRLKDLPRARLVPSTPTASAAPATATASPPPPSPSSSKLLNWKMSVDRSPQWPIIIIIVHASLTRRQPCRVRAIVATLPDSTLPSRIYWSRGLCVMYVTASRTQPVGPFIHSTAHGLFREQGLSSWR